MHLPKLKNLSWYSSWLSNKGTLQLLEIINHTWIVRYFYKRENCVPFGRDSYITRIKTDATCI
jgi:hypothetical protein